MPFRRALSPLESRSLHTCLVSNLLVHLIVYCPHFENRVDEANCAGCLALHYRFVRTSAELIRAQRSISPHAACRTQAAGMQRMGRGRLFGAADGGWARIRADNQPLPRWEMEATCRSANQTPDCQPCSPEFYPLPWRQVAAPRPQHCLRRRRRLKPRFQRQHLTKRPPSHHHPRPVPTCLPRVIPICRRRQCAQVTSRIGTRSAWRHATS